MTKPLRTFMVTLLNGQVVDVTAERFHVNDRGVLKFFIGPAIVALYSPFGYVSVSPVTVTGKDSIR